MSFHPASPIDCRRKRGALIRTLPISTFSRHDSTESMAYEESNLGVSQMLRHLFLQLLLLLLNTDLGASKSFMHLQRRMKSRIRA